jgi:hypothetical protein
MAEKVLEAPAQKMSDGEMHEELGKEFPLLGETPKYLGGSQHWNPKKKAQPDTMKFVG